MKMFQHTFSILYPNMKFSLGAVQEKFKNISINNQDYSEIVDVDHIIATIAGSLIKTPPTLIQGTFHSIGAPTRTRFIKDSIAYKQTGSIYTSTGELAMEDFQDIIFNYLFPGLVCKEQKELHKPIYLRRLSKKLIKICSTIMSNIYRKLYLSHKKLIGLNIIDYIILFEIILMIKTFTR